MTSGVVRQKAVFRLLTNRGAAKTECDEPITLSLWDPLFGFHNVPQNIVDAGQVTLTLRSQPREYAWVEPHTDRNLRPNVAQPNHLRQLLVRQPGNVVDS